MYVIPDSKGTGFAGIYPFLESGIEYTNWSLTLTVQYMCSTIPPWLEKNHPYFGQKKMASP